MHKIVLLVDDNSNLRKILRNHFETQFADISVHEAKDGFDAIEKVSQVHPDLIVLDMSMPRLNGVDTAHKLRELQVQTPIILFTLFATEVRISRIVPRLVNAVVSKTDLPRLDTTVTALLSSPAR